MNYEQLREKVNHLPMSPGVYLMKDKDDRVIYVGKAKKLKNRVSQYFVDTVSHSPKTKLMVSKIHHFEVIVAASEFEALILECSLIKRHQPKYNILLKDDKGYPYIRLDMSERFPTLSLETKTVDDGAEYFGPYGSRSITQDIIKTIKIAFRLPSCGKVFPRDMGKGRTCLNYHMDQCAGWCQGKLDSGAYRKAVEQVRSLLKGDYKAVSNQIRNEMLDAAESLNFELAANLRNRLAAIEALSKKQFVIAGSASDTDVVGFYQTEAKSCFSVLHYSGGDLLDKDYEIHASVEDPKAAVSSLLRQYYLSRGYAPKQIILPFEMEDQSLFEEILVHIYKHSVHLRIPQRGDKLRLLEMANRNAQEEAIRVTDRETRINTTLSMLENMLGISPLHRIESYDISNISGTDIVAGMVVFKDGVPKKSDYKRFKIKGMAVQDDYACMAQVLTRRFTHYIQGDKGFDIAPDLLLIDGGKTHAKIALETIHSMGLDFPVFGMVKDDRHRTRALMTPQGDEIAIDTKPSVFSLIGNIQEQTHNLAIGYHRTLRHKRLKYSELDNIPGIGPKRKEELLKQFKSLTGIASASLLELERVLPKDAAHAVFDHFKEKGR